MSRNYELLLEANQAQRFFQSPGTTTPCNGSRSRPGLEDLTREELLKLIQRVFLSPHLKSPRVVVFSGVDHGGGCSWICGRASEMLAARAAGRVCAVDANLRTPSLHQYFGVESHRGLADAVNRFGPVRDFAQRLPGGFLWVMPCGSGGPDPHTLLNSDHLRSRIAELRAGFDHIFIDAPPLNLYGDAILLGQLADGLVLVLESNSTRREVARKAKESLEAANVKVLGAVLNRRTYPIPEAIYWKF